MMYIIINPSLSAVIAYNLFFNLPKFAEVSAISEPANSTRTDYSSVKQIATGSVGSVLQHGAANGNLVVHKVVSFLLSYDISYMHNYLITCVP